MNKTEAQKNLLECLENEYRLLTVIFPYLETLDERGANLDQRHELHWRIKSLCVKMSSEGVENV